MGAEASDLLPGSGPATVSYTLGYQSKKLIQVSVLWLAKAESAEGLSGIVANANALRDYFSQQDLLPESIVLNRKGEDGSITAFQGQDKAGHTVIVTLLIGKKDADKTPAKDKDPAFRGILQVRYIANIKNPDILTVKPGSF